MRIFLVGFMGSGKSHCGRILAGLLGMPFVDLDDYVAKRAGMSITEIFAYHSEGYFRELERDVLLSLAALPYFVMATGGGTPCYHNLIADLNELGTTVFLDVAPELLLERLQPEAGHRPLLATAENLERSILDKLSERRPCYEQATIHLRIDNQTDDVARLVYTHLLRLQST
ncbi:Shikimate kinase [Neolewinella maritima]|uniref:Shikimate kinase n=1 Tax=Neolewinella maritima TaxID=1383882 RepID=A0ABN8F3N6_9BACT|nr:shikimate kinase [Neolewinella maritima]CAH1000395.1 Shikimate kinase [Neolewinella maritima]